MRVNLSHEQPDAKPWRTGKTTARDDAPFEGSRPKPTCGHRAPWSFASDMVLTGP